MKVESDFIEDVEKYTNIKCKDKKINEKIFNQIIEGFLVTIDELEANLEEAKTPYISEDQCEYGY